MPDLTQFPTSMIVFEGFTTTQRADQPKACRVVEQLDEGRRPESSGLNWSHYVDCELSTDIRDAVTRSAGANTLTYADGDKVKIPDDSGTVYVVVWVIVLGFGTPSAYKRAYLMRDTANFTGTGWS